MIKNSSKRRPGLSLVEVLVTGSLFVLILTMVGQAMVLGHRSQRSISTKLESVRRASLALDLLVRDALSARISSRVTYRNPGATTVPGTLTTVSGGGQELRIDRFQRSDTTLFGDPVSVGYWFVPGADPPTTGTVQRIIYDPFENPIAGYTSDGKTLVRNVRDFQVSRVFDATTNLWTLNAQISVGTVGRPITAAVSLENT